MITEQLAAIYNLDPVDMERLIAVFRNIRNMFQQRNYAIGQIKAATPRTLIRSLIYWNLAQGESSPHFDEENPEICGIRLVEGYEMAIVFFSPLLIGSGSVIFALENIGTNEMSIKERKC